MSQELQLRKDFVTEIRSDAQQQRIKESLPPDVSTEFFTAVVVRAVQEQPQLLAVDNKMSLFLACQRAAQDGLLPDKREGALIIYSEKVGNSWKTAVRWQPMIAGLRKKLANLGFDLVSYVVYENDEFLYELGDNERIEHRPPPLDVERGRLIGAYAIASQKGNKWREVMSKHELDAIKELSKSGDKGPWGNFYSEMCRKTVARRLIKMLPLHDHGLFKVIERDYEDYDLDPEEKAQETKSAAIQRQARTKVVKKKAPARKKTSQRKEPQEPKKAPVSNAKPEKAQENLPPDDSEIPPPDDSEIPPDLAAEESSESEEFHGVDPGF